MPLATFGAQFSFPHFGQRISNTSPVSCATSTPGAKIFVLLISLFCLLYVAILSRLLIQYFLYGFLANHTHIDASGNGAGIIIQIVVFQFY